MWVEKHNVSGRRNPVRMSICHTTFIIGAETLDIVNQSQVCWEKIRGVSDILDYIDISWTSTRNEIGMAKLYQYNSPNLSLHIIINSKLRENCLFGQIFSDVFRCIYWMYCKCIKAEFPLASARKIKNFYD